MRKALVFILILSVPFIARSQETLSENALIDAVSLFGEGEYEMARDSLAAILVRDSTVDAAYYYLGMLEYAARDFESAENCLVRAVELDSANTWYREALASIYTATGKGGEATEIYLDLLKENPRKYRNHYTLSLLADQTLAAGDDSLALEYYNQALMYDAGYVPAKLGIADIYRMQGNYGDFFDIVSEVMSNPILVEEAKEKYLAGLMSSFSPSFWREWKPRIMEIVGALCSTHAESTSAREFSLQIKLLYEDYEGAIEDCYKLIGLAGDNVQMRVSVLGEIGDLYHQMGEEKKAFEIYDKTLSIDPEYAPVLNNYAYFLCMKGKKLRKALRMSAKTIAQEPDNPTYLDTYGCILFLLGKPEEAKPYFKHAMIYGGKDNDEVLKHYSAVLDALGEKSLADYYRLQIKGK